MLCFLKSSWFIETTPSKNTSREIYRSPKEVGAPNQPSVFCHGTFWFKTLSWFSISQLVVKLGLAKVFHCLWKVSVEGERGIKVDRDNVCYLPSSGIKAKINFLWGRCFVTLSCSITVWYGKLTQTAVASGCHAGKRLWRGAEQAWPLCFRLYN